MSFRTHLNILSLSSAGFRIDVSVRSKVTNETGKADSVKFWFLVSNLDPKVTSVQGQVEADPNVYEAQKTGRRRAKKIKRELPTNASAALCRLLISVHEVAHFPAEVFGPENGLMAKLPTKRHLRLR